MSVWMENVTITRFEVCVRESRAMDGGHDKIIVVSHNTELLIQSKHKYSAFKTIKFKACSETEYILLLLLLLLL